jgi:hypothetical protein
VSGVALRLKYGQFLLFFYHGTVIKDSHHLIRRLMQATLTEAFVYIDTSINNSFARIIFLCGDNKCAPLQCLIINSRSSVLPDVLLKIELGAKVETASELD